MSQQHEHRNSVRVFHADVAVVGGGLAGLVAAACAARQGASVVLVEKASSSGGRAATRDKDGFLLNVGPHALYRDRAAAAVFAELGVSWSGRRPPASGGMAFDRGALHALPGGFVSLLSTSLLGLGGKVEVARVLGSIGRVDPASLGSATLDEWLATSFRDPAVRRLIEALMRLTSYANAPSRSSAAAALRQLQAGLASGVVYIDGGWRTLTEGLEAAARRFGVRVLHGARVQSLKSDGGGFRLDLGRQSISSATEEAAEEVPDGKGDSPEPGVEMVSARSVVLAVPPTAAAAVLGGATAAAAAGIPGDLAPVRAACLDLGLRRLPDPRRLFVLGIDRPLYFSVHSAAARLAPEGGALVHAAKYLGPGPVDARQVEAELEDFVDLVQPGWRGQVAVRRFLPQIMVAGSVVEASRRRPPVRVESMPGLFLAGDWVGDEGMIADAAAASGREAGLAAAAHSATHAGAAGEGARAVA